MSTRTPLARRIIAALLLTLITACQTWRPTYVSPKSLIPVERPSSVRATLRSGAKVTLENPTMRNDSIFGLTYAGVVGVASRDIGLLEVRKLSIWRTLGFGYLVFVFVVILACAMQGDECTLE